MGGFNLQEEETSQPYTHHKFAEGQASSPDRLAVNGKKGRRAVCVVAEDGIHYRVFDIDSGGGDVDEGEDVEMHI